MDDDDFKEFSDIANNLGEAADKKPMSPRRDDHNFFSYDNSAFSADDQDQDEYNCAQKEIYTQAMEKLEKLQKEQEVSML